MKRFDWDMVKNELLVKERNISFEEIVYFIDQGKILDIVENDNKKYTGQKIFVVDVNGYAYLVPFVETEDAYILKTIYPSRKATKEYLERED